MIKSMTGYGKSEAILPEGKLTVEIRTLNSKNADINIKSSLLPKDKELNIRQKITETLRRGTIDVYLTWEPNTSENVKKINQELAREYYSQISALGKALGMEKLSANDSANLLSTILKMPDVVDSAHRDIINDGNWKEVEKAFDTCLEAVDKYRSEEGAILYKDVTSRVSLILSLDRELEKHEDERIAAVRDRITAAAEELGISLNKERFEQEMIFYLEKFDINEEKVRLRQHCNYFIDTIDSEECPGKKLGFIIQEMGREINTTGSKANNAEIQKYVVRMKDELEKIREQSMNIL